VNEKTIWDFLLKETNNERGTAAIMGNLMAESSLNPRCVTGIKDPEYICKADNEEIDFAHDGHAFGLVQWCYHTRKAGLQKYAKNTGRSVGHLQMQLEYLVKEMSESYKSVWKAVTEATDIRTASDIVMLKYEKPAGTGEAAKAKRGAYAQKFYAEFANGSTSQNADTQVVPVVKRVEATENVRIRAGDSKSYGQVGSLKKGQSMEWVATSNGFHGVRMKDRVGWVSADFSKVVG